MQEAAFDASAAAGYDMQRYKSLGHLWLARQTEIEYLRPVVYNQEVEVKTWISDCGMQVIAAHGWPVQRMIAAGLAILIRKHQIQYLQPAVLDDDLELATWASDIRRSTAWRYYTIRRVRDGALVAQVNSLGVWVDLHKGVPVRIPAQFLADFAPNITS